MANENDEEGRASKDHVWLGIVRHVGAAGSRDRVLADKRRAVEQPARGRVVGERAVEHPRVVPDDEVTATPDDLAEHATEVDEVGMFASR